MDLLGKGVCGLLLRQDFKKPAEQSRRAFLMLAPALLLSVVVSQSNHHIFIGHSC